jgi:Beta-propeller repeat
MKFTKTIFSLMGCALATMISSASAQSIPGFGLVSSFGSATGDDAFGLDVDRAGNIYVAGYFSGNMALAGTDLNNQGGLDVYVAKYDNAGNALWARQAGGASPDVAYAVAVDGTGNNVYVAGRFGGTATFGTNTLNSAAIQNLFLAKYDREGNILWARQASGSGYEFARRIVLDESGGVYLAGAFQGPITFDGNTIHPVGQGDMLLAKYDSSGNFIWARHSGGASFYAEAYGLARDGAGNLFVTGQFANSITFGANVLASKGSDDLFLTKYDNSGNLLWARSGGGTGKDWGWAVATDKSGNSFVTGYFSGTATFSGTQLISSGSMDIFLAKYDPSGNLLWIRQGGGAGDDEGYGLTVDPDGNVVVTGWFTGAATFGTNQLTGLNSSTDIFVAKYSAAGDLLWVKQAGGKYWGFWAECDARRHWWIVSDRQFHRQCFV